MIQFPRWKIVFVVALCALGAVFALPNVLPRSVVQSLPEWMHLRQINLGLDLQGGSHLLLEVEYQVVLRERLEDLVSSMRRVLREESVGYTGLGVTDDAAVVTLRDAADWDRVSAALRDLGQPVDGGLFGGSASDLTVTEDGGQVRLALTERAVEARRRLAVQQAIEIVRRRIDETGTREPSIQAQGPDRILVQLPGVDDPDRVKRLLGETAKLNFHLVDEDASVGDALAGRVPPGSRLLYEEGSGGKSVPYVIRRRVMVSGENLVDAQPSFDQGRPIVSFRFDSVGGQRFGQATSENVGKRMAIVLDDKVISAPVIETPILGGSGIIRGRFTVQEVQDLALLLRAGALPAPLKILEERTVGPGLGADSIAAGQVASVLGLVFVTVFMAMAYGRFGVMADVALLVNLVLIVGLLSLLQATLTLPGIAGIVLTVGMAVDANVLIFERIREEARAGRSPVPAIDAGYKRALATIIDANLTTLIAAVLLFAVGSGPVKGFAVTLGIGILTSMFTAIMVTRLLVVLWLRRRRPAALPI